MTCTGGSVTGICGSGEAAVLVCGFGEIAAPVWCAGNVAKLPRVCAIAKETDKIANMPPSVKSNAISKDFFILIYSVSIQQSLILYNANLAPIKK